MATESTSKSQGAASSSKKRSYLKQADVPAASLDDALRVPQAVLDHYAGEPTAPLLVGKALNIDPGGSQMRLLTGAAIAYGLTDGGSQAASIEVLDLARRILRPTEESDDIHARREAFLRPTIFGEFLGKYDGNPIPRDDIAHNVLEGLGVPRDKAAEVFDRIREGAQAIGLLQEINGKVYAHLSPPAGAGATTAGESTPPKQPPGDEDLSGGSPALKVDEAHPQARTPVPQQHAPKRTELATAIESDERRRRVFITHGRNRDLVGPIKKLLEYGELEAVVSVERQSVSKPVPEKVLDEMRGCGAAIINVDADKTIVDESGNEHVLLNPNVLIEIGAAMAIYGRRFILLVREGVKLPSNLQGLYEVRYLESSLDASATIRLLEAIKDIKNYALPTEPRDDDDNN